MTCCVAAICDDGKTLILVADKMVGIGFIEAEPDISKFLELHKQWWLLFSGDDISSVFDIVDYAKQAIADKRDAGGHRLFGANQSLPLNIAIEVIHDSYQKKRLAEAESYYLKPIGWDIASFNIGGHVLPNHGEIQAKLQEYVLPIELIVAGFSDGRAYVFTLSGYGEERHRVKRHDIPGFASIGSGGTGVDHAPSYRQVVQRPG